MTELAAAVATPQHSEGRRRHALTWLLVWLLALGLNWARPLDQMANTQLEDSLQRAALAFGAARALNAGLSQLQSVTVEINAVVAQGGMAPFAWLDALDDLVEEVSSVLFMALLGLGALRAMTELTSSLGMMVFVSLLLVIAAGTRWWTGRLPPWLLRLALAALCLRLLVPVYGLASQAAQSSLQGQETEALAAISIQHLPSLPETVGKLQSSLSEKVDSAKTLGAGAVEKLSKFFGVGSASAPASAAAPAASVPAAAATPLAKSKTEDRSWADRMAEALIRLAGLFVVQVLILPLAAWWAMRWLYHLLTERSRH